MSILSERGFLCSLKLRGYIAHNQNRATDSSLQIKRHFVEIGIGAAVHGNRLMAL